jgi:hypothetical protein
VTRVRREANALRLKALASLRRSADAFNSSNDDGRVTSTLLHLQHAFEMLLKAALVQKRQKVMDPDTGRSYGFEKCVNLAKQHLGLNEADAGVLRAIDSMRDDEQHYHALIDEALLHTHCRAAVPIFDTLLQAVFGERLADQLPVRVLPLATRPPEDVQALIDAQFSQVKRLLRPGTRRQADARAMVRGLLALEAHTSDRTVQVSEKDVTRVVQGVRAGKSRVQVFPKLSTLGTESIDGGELLVKVKFVRNDPSAVPVRFVAGDEDAAAIRLHDMRDKFHWSATELAKKLGISTFQSKALRWKLGIDDDESCRYVFTFGKTRHPMFSDNAYTKMRDTLAEPGFSTQAAWLEYRAAR